MMSSFNTPFFTDMNFTKPHSLSSQEQQRQSSSSMSSEQQKQQNLQQQQLQQQQQQQQQLQQQSHSAPNASFKFNMSEFRPEDISITVTDTTLKIHALREELDGGNGKTYRKYKFLF